MPRSTSRRRSSTPVKKQQVPQTVPKQTSQPVPQQASQPVPQQASTLGDAIKSGVGMGLGIEAVRGAIGMFKNNEQPVEVNKNINVCEKFNEELVNCMNKTPDNCKDIFNALQLCNIMNTM